MSHVSEDIKPQEKWFKRAKKIKDYDEFVDFAKELFENTEHDYNTTCHAIAAICIAAGWLGSNKLNITGFQASCIMWDFITQWMYSTNKCGLALINYDNMLYPQYWDRFEKTITAEQFKKMQEIAAKNLKEEDSAHSDVLEHWQEIVKGKIPFGFTIKD